MRKLHIIFHSSCTVYIPINSVQVSLFLIPCWHLLFLVLLVIAILSCVRWYLTVALIFISLMVSDVEHLFMCLLAISMFLGKCLFRSSAQLLIQLFGGFFFKLYEFLYFLDINPLLDIMLANIFSKCNFILLTITFNVQNCSLM